MEIPNLESGKTHDVLRRMMSMDKAMIPPVSPGQT